MTYSRLLMVSLVLLTYSGIHCPVVTGQTSSDQELKTGLSNVLRMSGIAREIEMTSEQNDQLLGLWLEAKFKLDQAYSRFKQEFSESLPDEQKADIKAELSDAVAQVRKLEAERLEGALTEAQLRRLKQLRTQYIVKHVGMAELTKELKLTADQNRKIKQVAEELKNEIAEVQAKQRTDPLSRSELAEIARAIRASSEKKLKGVLTETQRRKLSRLQGEAFDFKTGRPAAGSASNEPPK